MSRLPFTRYSSPLRGCFQCQCVSFSTRQHLQTYTPYFEDVPDSRRFRHAIRNRNLAEKGWCRVSVWWVDADSSSHCRSFRWALSSVTAHHGPDRKPQPIRFYPQLDAFHMRRNDPPSGCGRCNHIRETSQLREYTWCQEVVIMESVWWQSRNKNGR